MNPLTLAFTGEHGVLEKEFLDEYNQASLKEIRMSVLIGAVIICLFAVLDEFVLPTEKYVMWMLRCASLIPAVVLLYLLTYWKGVRRVLPLAQSVALLLTGLGCTAMILRATAPANFVYSSGLVLILMFGFTVLRLRFIWGTIVGWTVVFAYVIAAVRSIDTGGIMLLKDAFVLGSANIIGMIASYSIERHTRRDFLLRKQIEKGNDDVRKQVEETLQHTIDEKEMLLKELQHRVKNNLAIISSLLGLEMRKISDEKSRQVFREAQTRIYSMSTLYEQLVSTGDPGSVDLRGYLEKLARTVFRTYGAESERISLTTELDHIFLDVKRAVPLGLILNELLTNAVKYAFPEGRAGAVRVELQEHTGRITLEITDDGVGLPADFDMNAPGSMGLTLVKMLCEQIGGEMTITGTRGSRVSASFAR